MSAICRLCLAEGGTFYPLFRFDEVESHAMQLALQVKLCTSITVSKSDNFPKKICINCHSFVRQWYIFRRKCLQANETLKFSIENKDDNNLIWKSGKEILSTGHDILEYQNNEVHVSNVQSQICSLKQNKRKKCRFCPDSFLFDEDLKKHESSIHTYQSNLSCTKKPTSNNKTLNFIWQCCGQVFDAKSLFRQHIINFHPDEKPFACDECGKKGFISEQTLKRHKMLHSGRYGCKTCGKTFTCHSILRIHERDKHENDRPFICDLCGKTYVTELRLIYHQRFHTGEKNYVCEICGMAVSTSSSFAKHKRTHSHIKPHICDICKKGFIVRARLVEHMRVHTGERPYTCDICLKGFTMHDKLKRHLKTHSEEKSYCCEVCGNAYSTNHGLSIHRKSHITRQQDFIIFSYVCIIFAVDRVTLPIVAADNDFDQTKHPNWSVLDHENCGEGRNPEKRIIGGTEATLGEKPWLARIGYTSPDFSGISYRCGGAILTKNIVITAAHCVHFLPPNYVVSAVMLGEHSTKTDPDCEKDVCAEKAQVIKPMEIITHSEYNVQPFTNDIALIRLQREIQLNEFVKPICLPTSSAISETLVGKKVEVAGWGIYDLSREQNSEILLKVVLTVQENEVCKKEYLRHAPIGPTQICVGGEIGKDSCGGDSGGPLMLLDSTDGDPRMFMVGIVSFGSKKCGETAMPGIYTRIQSYMFWILENLQENRVKFLIV